MTTQRRLESDPDASWGSGPAQIHEFTDEGLGNSSWLVETGDGRALVVDPSRDPRPYMQLAERRNLTLAFSAETHLHADFVSGSRELAACGATIVAPAAGGVAFAHRGLAAGDEVDLGGLRLRALATPGHTPEHLAYLLVDDETPLALFSGGSLLVGAVARTDLISPEQTEPLTRRLWRSLQETVVGLPDDLAVYPTHGAGSFCSASGGSQRWTTVGQERASNPLLASPDEDAFVAGLLGRLGSYPPYFLTLRELNRRGPRVYGDQPPSLAPRSVDSVVDAVSAGSELVDVRPFRQFAAGHIAGSLSIPLRPQFASWLGWLVAPDRKLIFVADADADRDDIVRQCLKIGYETIGGELAGGTDAWVASGRHLESVELVGPGDVVASRLLDVRQDAEFDAGHVPGSTHRELGDLAERTDDLGSGPLTLMCVHGERAMTAASLLARTGRRDLSVMDGGPAEWSAGTERSLVTGR